MEQRIFIIPQPILKLLLVIIFLESFKQYFIKASLIATEGVTNNQALFVINRIPLETRCMKHSIEAIVSLRLFQFQLLHGCIVHAFGQTFLQNQMMFHTVNIK